jgi:hypothetical protein
MPKRVKIFANKFPSFEDPYWNEVESVLNEKGHQVYRESSECDVALMMNAAFLNPSVYKEKYGFYFNYPNNIQNGRISWFRMMTPILEKYYDDDKLIDVFGMKATDTANIIIQHYIMVTNDNN